MRKLSDKELNRLVDAIVEAYPDRHGEGEFLRLCEDLSYRYGDFHPEGIPRKEGHGKLLRYYNVRDPGLTPLCKVLRASKCTELSELVERLVDTPQTPDRPWRQLLIEERLLVDGLPMLNHDNLRGAFLRDLLDTATPQRVLFLSGQADSGKTFAQNLIRSVCWEAEILYALIDKASTAVDRSSLQLAQTIARKLELEHFQPPGAETSHTALESQLVARLGEALRSAQRRVGKEKEERVLLVFDDLNQDLSPEVLTLIEQIALGAAMGPLHGLRVVLISYTRQALASMPRARKLEETVRQPDPAVAADYLLRVVQTLRVEMTRDELLSVANDIYAGHTAPYSKEFMRELPGEVLKVVEGLLRLRGGTVP